MSKMSDLYEKTPRNAVMDAMGAYGKILMSVGNNDMGRQLVELMHRGIGKTIGGITKLTDAAESRETVEVVKEFMEYFFYSIIAVEEESTEELVVTMSECPYGYCGEEHSDLCRATMNLEQEMIDQLGGELIIEESIAEGANKCRFRIRNF